MKAKTHGIVGVTFLACRKIIERAHLAVSRAAHFLDLGAGTVVADEDVEDSVGAEAVALGEELDSGVEAGFGKGGGRGPGGAAAAPEARDLCEWSGAGEGKGETYRSAGRARLFL